MTRFSADWHARRELSVLESERKLVDKTCGVGEFVATGMGTARMDLGAKRRDGSAVDQRIVYPPQAGSTPARVATKSHAAGDAGSGNAPTRTSPRCDSSSAVVASVYPLVTLCLAHGLTAPIPEYRFHAVRKWRFDYAWPLTRIAVEIEGGIWTQGRHTRGAGAIEDMRKYSAAALLGWRILYYQPSELLLAIADLRIEFAR